MLIMEPYTPEKLPISNLSWDRFISKIDEANRSLARYDGTLSAMINPGLLLSPLTTQEAVLSSRIKGTGSTQHLKRATYYAALGSIAAEDLLCMLSVNLLRLLKLKPVST